MKHERYSSLCWLENEGTHMMRNREASKELPPDDSLQENIRHCHILQGTEFGQQPELKWKWILPQSF